MAKPAMKNRTIRQQKIAIPANFDKELQQIHIDLKNLKKSYQTQLTTMQAEFKRNLKTIVTTAYQKAFTDFIQDTAKRQKAKTKMLRETANNFNENFKSKFAAEPITKNSKPKKKPTAKRRRLMK